MKTPHMKEYAILGYSSFCASVAEALSRRGASILVCDKDERKVSRALEFASESVQADLSDAAALRELELQNYDVVIIDTGDDIRAASRATINWRLARKKSSSDSKADQFLLNLMFIFPFNRF